MTNLPDSESQAAYSNTPNCLVCGEALDLRQTQGRSSRKPSIMFVCPVDGRHFRAFVTYRPFVEAVLERLATHVASSNSEDDLGDGTTPSKRSKTNLERAS